jgi:ATP-dependent exoDNAse (exonuclease V) alpha subunit
MRSFAKEFIIALPVELSREQNIALMRQFVFEQVLARGQVADWVYHDEPGNPHVHLMTTLRPLTETGSAPRRSP